MARAAGNSSHYADEVWRPHYTGPDDPGPVRPLPSVTHIIKSTLAKPQLVGWAYRTTRDVMASMLATMTPAYLNADSVDGYKVIELLQDADVWEEWLKDNKLRITDITKEHANRGTAEHFHLEELTKRQRAGGGKDLRLAERFLKSGNGWRRGIGAWWLANRPFVIASELVLPHPRAGYAGSVDLIWRNSQDAVGVTDLKTRLEDREAYDSDEFQVDGYASAWQANGHPRPDFLSVLVARPDGSVIDHRDFVTERGAFSKVLDLYVARKGGGEE